MAEETFGGFFKKQRLTLGLTLRKFSEQNGFDPGNISKIERGILGPPLSRKRFNEYAKALGVWDDFDKRLEFLDLAIMGIISMQENEILANYLNSEERVSICCAMGRI